MRLSLPAASGSHRNKGDPGLKLCEPAKTQPYPEGLIFTSRGPLVLLFFDGYDLSARPGFSGKIYSQARRFLRYTKKTILRQQVHTGFYTAFLALVEGLKRLGCNVRVNDFRLAEKYSDYPIGIAGYPSANRLGLRPRNPRILGPGDFGTPADVKILAADPRYKKFIQPSQWFSDLYIPYGGKRIVTWFAGIDMKKWRDLSYMHKDTDFLVYDKVTFDREQRLPEVLGKILHYLMEKGYSYLVLSYGQHHISQFRKALERSRAMVFLSQHETQGIACQEAMASNVPVLAWDEGKFLDPSLRPFLPAYARVSSVPYFSGECGMRFRLAKFEQVCEDFWRKRHSFTPRRYIENHLSLELSAARYLREYAGLALSPPAQAPEKTLPSAALLRPAGKQ